jgi:hypothetical protein
MPTIVGAHLLQEVAGEMNHEERPRSLTGLLIALADVLEKKEDFAGAEKLRLESYDLRDSLPGDLRRQPLECLINLDRSWQKRDRAKQCESQLGSESGPGS